MPYSALRFRQIAAYSALLGLLSGLGEAGINLAVGYYALDTLYVTLIANVIVFLILGSLFGMLGLGLKPQPAYFLIFVILLWALFNGWEQELGRSEYDYFWLLRLSGTCLIAVLLSLWTLKRTEKVLSIASRTLPWTLAIILASFATSFLSHRDTSRAPTSNVRRDQGTSPNIVLIVVDALRADHLSCYHYERLTSPNLDQLAAKGVVFENAIATSSWTLPSHASMFTGLYPSQHRAQSFWDQLRVDIPTISEQLQQAGYRTGGFSGSSFFTPRQGLDRGFAEFKDFYFSPVQAFTHVHYIASLIKYWKKTGWLDENIAEPSGIQINESVTHWIDRTQGPFFLTLNYFEVHERNSIPEAWQKRFSAARNPNDAISDQNGRVFSRVAQQIQGEIDRYDSAIAYDDDLLQRLTGELAKRRLLDNTLVIVTADHGEGLGEHGVFTHGNALYYPLIHVPLIFYWPGHLPAGIRIDRPVSLKDLPATILELSNVSHSQFPGNSLAAFWNGQTNGDQWPMPVSELLLHLHLLRRWRSGGTSTIQSIISPEFQLIYDLHVGASLYRWREDPQESENLFSSPPYQRVGGELAAVLKRNQ